MKPYSWYIVAACWVTAFCSGCDSQNTRPSVTEAVGTRGENNGSTNETAQTTELGTVRYLLPDRSGDPIESFAPTWDLAAPEVDGFSNPNLIAYDQAYIDAYANWALNAATACGVAPYEVVVGGTSRKFDDGLDQSYLGYRYRAEDLLQFIQRRIDGPNRVQSFTIRHPEALKTLAKRTDLPNRRLAWSPWDRDISTAIFLLVGIEHKPVYPLLKALLKDPSDDLRGQVLIYLGKLAPHVPSAVDDIVPFVEVESLRSVAFSALALAGSSGLPAIIKLMDHNDAFVRNQAVASLARMDEKVAVAGLHAALVHQSTEVRECAFSVLIDRQGRGAETFDEQLLDAVINRLGDEDQQIRSQATAAIRNFGIKAARSRPALLKAREEHPSMRNEVNSALFAIDGVTPPKSGR